MTVSNGEIGHRSISLSCRAAEHGEFLSDVDRQFCPSPAGPPLKAQASVSAMVGNQMDAMPALNKDELSAIWGLAAASVVGLYLLAACAGAVLSFIRRS